MDSTQPWVKFEKFTNGESLDEDERTDIWSRSEVGTNKVSRDDVLQQNTSSPGKSSAANKNEKESSILAENTDIRVVVEEHRQHRPTHDTDDNLKDRDESDLEQVSSTPSPSFHVDAGFNCAKSSLFQNNQEMRMAEQINQTAVKFESSFGSMRDGDKVCDRSILSHDSSGSGWIVFDEIPSQSASQADTPKHAAIVFDAVNKAESLCLTPQYYRKDVSAASSHTSTPSKCWISFDDETPSKRNLAHLHDVKASSSYGVDGETAMQHGRPMSNKKSSAKDMSRTFMSGTHIPDMYEIGSDDFSVDSPSQPHSSNDDMNFHFCETSSIDNQDSSPKKQPVDSFETDSNFSGEICDLNNLENDSLLKDTRKKFPKEELFQASSTKKQPSSNDKSISESPTKHLERDNQGEVNTLPPLDDYPPQNKKNEWVLMYRYPDHKKKLGSREWVNVKVKVIDDSIKISGRFGNAEIHKEIPLHPFFAFTLPVLCSQGNNGSTGKVHSVKLQYVKYKEKRKMSSKFHLEHVPSYTPVLKLASKDRETLKQFIDAVENVMRKIESHRDKGITHRHEEIFIDCDDICHYEVDGNGQVKRYNITCQVRLRAFVTGIPDLYLFVNDIETYSKQKNRRGDCKPPKSNRWIRLEKVDYHPCINVSATKQEGGIVFKPPDSCGFELMRFRTRNNRGLPIIFKCSIDFTTTKSFEIKAECKVGGEGKMMKYQRNNIVVRFPVPTTWTSVFVKSRGFNGRKRYVQAKADPKTFASGVARTARCFVEVSTGCARYEAEYGAIVWRIGDLPILANGVPADAVQTFSCQVNLPFEIDLPESYVLTAEVEFDVNHAIGSEIQIHEVLLSDKRMPDKWVCYKASYFYTVLLNVINRQRLASLS